MTANTTPESGTTNVYYTTSGGALCSGNPSNACRRLDARNVNTTYAYDALNRLEVIYFDGTPTMAYYYDQTSFNGLTITNGKGRRTGMSDESGATAWSYDPAGRIVTERRTISGVAQTISYSYNLDGSLASLTYPSGRTITYGVSAIGRAISAKDLTNNVNYVTSAQYAPQGALASLKNGYTGSFAGITTTNSYNNRLEPTLLSAASPSQTVLSLSYGFGTNNNEQIASMVNNINNNRTQSLTYDVLRQLLTAQSQATSGSDCWGQGFGYDRWANLLTATVTKCSAPSLNVTVNSATNRINSSGFTYDAAGAMTTEGATTYAWNDANQITTAAGVTYTYDGNGLRVKKSNGKLYWRGAGVNTLAETDLSGNTTSELIYFVGRLVAVRDASTGNVYYFFGDQVGSTRVVTDASGTVCYDTEYFPFGGENVKLGTCPQAYKFTGYERDPETGLDYAITRYYNSRLGRFMSPDQLGGTVLNPRSLNLYAYVQNDPCNYLDPFGLERCALKVSLTSTQNIPPDQMNDLKTALQSIYGQIGIDITFVTQGQDFTLVFGNPPEVPPADFGWYPGHGSTSGYVASDKVMTFAWSNSFYGEGGLASGRIAAHELGHGFGLSDSNSGVMAGKVSLLTLDPNADWYFKFTAGEAVAARQACQDLRRRGRGNRGNGRKSMEINDPGGWDPFDFLDLGEGDSGDDCPNGDCGPGPPPCPECPPPVLHQR
jgi:RHS repeat-associated protein